MKAEIARLPPSDLTELAQWIDERRADAWDRQIARDVRVGRFDAILQRVNEQAEAGECRSL